MSSRNTLVRSLHDLGVAAWFGGSLMGAIGVNGATRNTAGPDNPLAVAASGWARWTPVATTAIGAHLVGGAGLIWANRDRINHQDGVHANTLIKAGLTLAAVAATGYSGVLGAHLATETDAPAEASTVPGSGTPQRVARSQQQLRVLQWVTPALTGALIVLGAQQGEQQKPGQVAQGVARRTFRRVAHTQPAGQHHRLEQVAARSPSTSTPPSPHPGSRTVSRAQSSRLRATRVKERQFMIGFIISAIIVGAIVGLLGRLILPGRQNICLLMTVLIGSAGAQIRPGPANRGPRALHSSRRVADAVIVNGG